MGVEMLGEIFERGFWVVFWLRERLVVDLDRGV